MAPGPLTSLAQQVRAGGNLPALPLPVPAGRADGAAALAALAGATPTPAVWGVRAEAALASDALASAAAAVQAWVRAGGDARALDLRLRPYLEDASTFVVLDGDTLAPTALLVALVQRLHGVLRLQAPGAARGHGTGFAVAGEALHPSLEGEILVMTNAHVCSEAAVDQAKGARPPSALVAAHFGADDALVAEHPVAEVIWSSHTDLDASLLRLATAPPVAPLPLSRRDVLTGRTRALPVGYPEGGARAFSMPPRTVDEVRQQWLTYRSATLRGMSGSPVFDGRAEVIGLHHAGDPEVNEGTLISVIQAEIGRALG